jgi:hypothetical protein
LSDIFYVKSMGRTGRFDFLKLLIKLINFIIEGGSDELELVFFHHCEFLCPLVLFYLLLDIPHTGEHINEVFFLAFLFALLLYYSINVPSYTVGSN